MPTGPQIGRLLRAIVTTALCAALLTACGDKTSSAATTGTTSGSTTTAAAMGSATLSWTPPLQNTDGSMLTDLAGYHVYYGTDLSALDKMVTLTSASQVWYVVQNLSPGTWYFTVRSYNAAGVESDFSQSASETI